MIHISYLLEWFCKGGSFHISSCMHTLMQIYQNIFMFPTRTQARAVMIKNIILNRTLLMHNPNKTKCFATLIVYYTSNIQKQKLGGGGGRGAREVLSSVAPLLPLPSCLCCLPTSYAAHWGLTHLAMCLPWIPARVKLHCQSKIRQTAG